EPRAEAALVGPNPAYVGQMSQVEVSILRDDRATNKPAPFFPEVRVRGAVCVLSKSAPPPEVREIAGVPFLVQKRRYLVFPEQAGQLTIPGVGITVADGNGAMQVVSTKPVELKADIPSGTAGRVPVVAKDVQVERSIDADLGALRVGDSFTVRVKVTAVETDAIMLPPIEAPDVAGLARYPGEATSTTNAERGRYRAERVDSVTYVANEWGFFTLPRISVFWLDPSTGRYDEAVADAVSFRARVNPHLGAGCVGGPQAAAKLSGSLLLLVAAVFVTLRLRRHLRAVRARRARVQQTAGEKVAFAILIGAAKSGNDGATLSALYAWLRYALASGVPTLERLRASGANKPLVKATEALEQRVAAGSKRGTPFELVPPLERYRKSSKPPSPRDTLPELNG
ncbi:MAG TPA: hypothetical protein VI197_16965, partial [Polyangiaceae bacterium]